MIKILKKEYYKKKMIEGGYLFKSYYKKYVKSRKDYNLKIVSVNRFFGKMRKELDIDYPLGTHSMRKTWGLNIIQIRKRYRISYENVKSFIIKTNFNLYWN